MAELRFDLTPFLDQDEGQHFDRKSLYEGTDSAKRPRNRRAVRDQVAEYIASFANAEGGVLILGIEDDRTITGHQLPQDALNSILKTSSTRLQPAQPDGFIMHVEGCEVIVFDVPASDVPVQVIGDGFPLRMGDQTVQSRESQINKPKFEGMRGESGKAGGHQLLWIIWMGDLSRTRAIKGRACRALSDEAYLLNRKLADLSRVDTETSCYRNAADVALCTRDGPDHPNAGVRLISRHWQRPDIPDPSTGLKNARAVKATCLRSYLKSALSSEVCLRNAIKRRLSRVASWQASVEYTDFAWIEAMLKGITRAASINDRRCGHRGLRYSKTVFRWSALAIWSAT